MTSWLAHNDDNKLIVFYDSEGETEKTQIRYLATLIRRGLWVREITDKDKIGPHWAEVVPESLLRKTTNPPIYDFKDGSAVDIAKMIVDHAKRET